MCVQGVQPMPARADFSESTRRLLAERAGHQCSIPRCGQRTIGPGAVGNGVVRVGMAAHIYAAAVGGPRGTGGLSEEERRSAANGIWCCYLHGKAIDDDDAGMYSAAHLRAWKRLHEARMGAEVNNGVAFDNFGLVDTIAIHSAPASLSGRKFDFGMCNVITGPNGSGKTILSRLISSVANPDHVAEISARSDVDIAVRWFDPLTHEVHTSGRAGEVRHVLDGRQVPYVTRPFKTIHVSEGPRNSSSVTRLAERFQMSATATRAILRELPDLSGAVRRLDLDGDRIHVAVEYLGEVWADERCSPGALDSLFVLDFAAAVARHHAASEPTFLIVDDFMSLWDSAGRVEISERLQHTVGDAQVAVISTKARHHLDIEFRGWSVLALDDRQPRGGEPVPIELEVTSTRPNGASTA